MPTVAYRVTRSRKAFVNAPKVKAILEQALDGEVKPHFISEFDKIVANWEHKPTFQGRKFITTDAIQVNVYPTGINKRIYEYVTGGTRPHIIRAKNAPVLAFMWGGPGSYKPKTTPAPSWGGPGVASGKMTYRKEVHHPGTEARNFEKFVKEQNKQWFSRTMENAWGRAIRAMSR